MGKIKRTFGFIATHPISKRHVLKSLYRFLLWQLQTGFAPTRLFVKRFAGPVKFYARKGLTGVTGNIYAGLHDFNEMAFLLHFLREGDVFFDIGANVGSYTLLASGLSKVKSVALEPVSSTFDLLVKNIALNGLQDKVTAIHAAAGATQGSIYFTSGNDTTNHALAANETGEQATIEVKLTSIDSLTCSQIPRLAKIDVEGFETEVLRGMHQTLESKVLKAIIIELNGSGGRYGFDEKAIHQLLLDKQFNPYSYDPFTRVLSPLPSYGTHNTIYCRDLAFINNRLQSARAIKIMGEVI